MAKLREGPAGARPILLANSVDEQKSVAHKSAGYFGVEKRRYETSLIKIKIFTVQRVHIFRLLVVFFFQILAIYLNCNRITIIIVLSNDKI